MLKESRKRRSSWIGFACALLLIASMTVVPSAISDADEGPPTPEAAYNALAVVVEANDLEGFKALMSAGLAKRLSNDFYIAEGLRSGKEYLGKVPIDEPKIREGNATFSKTYDEENVTATYSIEFAEENGRWLFDGYKTSTKSK